MTSDRALHLVAATLAVVLLLLGVLLWTEQATLKRIVRARSSLEAVAYAERSLERELLGTRLGLTRHYDKVNLTMASAEAGLRRLTSAAPAGSPLEAAAADLARLVRSRDVAVERFKGDNALLQNALARFATLSEPPIEETSSNHLPADILRLTLDPSREAVAEARREIAYLERHPSPSGEAVPSGLFTQARLLTVLLPTVDATLRDLRADRVLAPIERVRSVLAEDYRRSLLSYHMLTTGLVLGVLAFMATGLIILTRGIMRSRQWRQRAANDHLEAAAARALLGPSIGGDDARVERVLDLMASHVGAQRAFLILDADGERRLLSWPHEPDGGPEDRRRTALLRMERDWTSDGTLTCGPMGVGSVLLIRVPEDHSVVLGVEFDAMISSHDPEMLAGLRLALARVVHGFRRRAAERERLSSERRRAAAERLQSIGTIASGVAHNVNNLLGVIGGFGEMARARARKGSAISAHLDEIAQAVTRGRVLVDDILGFAGGRSPTPVVVDVGDLVEQTGRQFQAAHGTVAIRIDVDRQAFVLGDPVRLQQVLLNICNNAADVRADGLAIEVTMARRTLAAARRFSHAALPAGDYVMVSIADNGPGMDADLASRVFEPFFTTRPAGTGLGLSTAWTTVSNHEGTIDLTCSDRGCRFDLWLPTAPAINPNLSPGGERVLLWSAPNRVLADEDILARLGYEPVRVIEAASAREAAATLRDVDAILVVEPLPTDLPHWREQLARKDIPLVVVTADSRPWRHLAPTVVALAHDPARLARALRTAIDGRTG